MVLKLGQIYDRQERRPVSLSLMRYRRRGREFSQGFGAKIFGDGPIHVDQLIFKYASWVLELIERHGFIEVQNARHRQGANKWCLSSFANGGYLPLHVDNISDGMDQYGKKQIIEKWDISVLMKDPTWHRPSIQGIPTVFVPRGEYVAAANRVFKSRYSIGHWTELECTELIRDFLENFDDEDTRRAYRQIEQDILLRISTKYFGFYSSPAGPSAYLFSGPGQEISEEILHGQVTTNRPRRLLTWQYQL